MKPGLQSSRPLIGAFAEMSLDVDALADAISALESGDALTDDQASVLQEVVDRSRPDKAADPTVPLSILQKQIDLWGKDL